MKQIIRLNRRIVIVEKVTNQQSELWFKSILNNLTHKTIDKEKYPNFMSYIDKNSKCLFVYDLKTNFFYYSLEIYSIQREVNEITRKYFNLK